LWLATGTGKKLILARFVQPKPASMPNTKTNVELLQDKSLNKLTAFTREEREALRLRGLLPYAVSTQESQMARAIGNLRRKESDIEKYIFLSSLQERNERLFFRILIEHIDEMLPLVYTPTVGQACKEFSHIFRHTQGFYVNPEDRGEIDKIVQNWPNDDVRVIVVTDGQRILGLGDLGANGMGIPIGKLALYCAFAGIEPNQCMPVMLDVGTNNEELLHDPLYIGYPHRRLEGDAYFSLVDEFITAILKRYPDVLIQFEDFQTPNAYRLLHLYQEKLLCFNDDIQGTAAVALSGVFASSRITGMPYKDLKILFLGAGSAATGIADLMVSAFEDEGLSRKEALERLWFVDGKGLVVSSRTDLADHKKPFAHDYPYLQFMDALEALKPNVLIGATGAGSSFPKEVIEKMCSYNERPVIFALSNPTSRAECTAEQAYTWSKGKAVFASGSPFPEVEFEGKKYKSGQGNNAYIFPGIGLAALVTKAKYIRDDIFLLTARKLASIVSQEDIDRGSLYPPLRDIRSISLEIATAVAEKIYADGLARAKRPADLRETIRKYMYDPRY
jgi:malate dehydrogenase (oxaloacetate-decarboxylating)(NADP+)